MHGITGQDAAHYKLAIEKITNIVIYNAWDEITPIITHNPYIPEPLMAYGLKKSNKFYSIYLIWDEFHEINGFHWLIEINNKPYSPDQINIDSIFIGESDKSIFDKEYFYISGVSKEDRE